MTHWKTLMNKKYLGSWDLEDGQKLTLTIESIIKEDVKASAGADEETLPVLVFKEDVKNMILNNTNGETLEKIFNTIHHEHWIGKRFTLYVQSGIRTRKGLVNGLRVSNQLPKPLEAEKKELTPEINGGKTWENAVTAIKDGAEISKITDRYKLSDENKTKLLSYVGK